VLLEQLPMEALAAPEVSVGPQASAQLVVQPESEFLPLEA